MHFNNANKNIIATKLKIDSRSDILKAQNNKWFHIKEDSRILLNQKNVLSTNENTKRKSL